MWYEGEETRTWSRRIGCVVSSEGTWWRKVHSKPVLDAGPPGTWNDSGVGSPCVAFDGDLYRMWYAGYDARGRSRIGYAVSAEGLRWRPWPDPVFGGTDPCVLQDRGRFRMWFCDSSGIGYASSEDGVSWTRSNLNPILSDDARIRKPCVIRDGPLYRMWYVATDRSGRSTIGCACSTNGIAWTQSFPNPVLSSGPEEDLRSCHVLAEGDSLRMWYSTDDAEGTGRIRHRAEELGGVLFEERLDLLGAPLSL